MNGALSRWFKSDRTPWRVRYFLAIGVVISALFLTGCGLPQVSAQDRLFLDLSVEFLDAEVLPDQLIQDSPVGGLSGITYDRQRDRFYAVSDDRSSLGPARFYTLALTLDATDDHPSIAQIEVEAATPLQTPEGDRFAPNTIDPEGIALSPRQSVFISSEGVARDGIPPSIQEFELATGKWLSQLPIPERYTPQIIDDEPSGVQDNLGFEALTLNPGGYSTAWLEPFRLFVAIESALTQDLQPEQTVSEIERMLTGEMATVQSRNRLMHYLVGDDQSTLIAEHLYLLEPDPPTTVSNGLVELLVIDQAGHFLSLERSFGLTGFGAKLFQLATGGATDISSLPTLSDTITGIAPIQKQLLLDLGTLELDVPLDNVEGMTLGPQLPDGSQSLIVVSDNNFDDAQVTQVLLFRLNQ
jgi:hypothetical protein